MEKDFTVKNVFIFAMNDSQEIYTIVVTSTVYIFKHLFKLSSLFDNIYFWGTSILNLTDVSQQGSKHFILTLQGIAPEISVYKTVNVK